LKNLAIGRDRLVDTVWLSRLDGRGVVALPAVRLFQFANVKFQFAIWFNFQAAVSILKRPFRVSILRDE
jgi:hypothetical protein